jgi:cell pole-organizing protein PopZ
MKRLSWIQRIINNEVYMSTKISDSTKNVLDKLKNVMGDPGATTKLKIKAALNTDDGKKLKLHSEAPDNLNDEIIENTKSSKDSEEFLETQESILVPEFEHEQDSPKSSRTEDTEGSITESIIINSVPTSNAELNKHQDDSNSNTLERNWQSAVQDELQEIIQFNDAKSDSVDLDQGFGIDKINNVKPVMNLAGDKNINLQKSINEEMQLSDIATIGVTNQAIDSIAPTPPITEKIPVYEAPIIPAISSISPLMEQINKRAAEAVDTSDLSTPIGFDFDDLEKDTPISDNNLDVSKESDFDVYDFNKAALQIDSNAPTFNNLANFASDKIGNDMQNSANKVMSDKTYNRARNIIDSFRNQVNNNTNTKPTPAPQIANNDSLETLVGNLIKPMLKDWLENNLTEIVEEIVTKEVKKITGNK